MRCLKTLGILALLLLRESVLAGSTTEASFPRGRIHVAPQGEKEQGCIGGDLTWNRGDNCAIFVVTKWFSRKHRRFQLAPDKSDWSCNINGEFGNAYCMANNPKEPCGWSTRYNNEELQDGSQIGPFRPFNFAHEAVFYAYGKPGACEKASVFDFPPIWAPTINITLHWHPEGTNSASHPKPTPADNTRAACSTSEVPHQNTRPPVPSPVTLGYGPGKLNVIQNGVTKGCLGSRATWIADTTKCQTFSFGRYTTGLWTVERVVDPCIFKPQLKCDFDFEGQEFFFDGTFLVNPILDPKATKYSTTFYANKAVESIGDSASIYNKGQPVPISIQVERVPRE